MTETNLISRTQVAYMLNVDVRTLSTYQKRETDPLPIAVQGRRGQPHRYDLQAMLRWAVRQEIARLGVADDGTVLDLEHERARLAKAQADKTERENAVRDRELAPVDALTFAIADVARQQVAIFEAIPKRLKNAAPFLKAAQIKIVEREIIKARNLAANIQIKFDTSG